MTLRECYEGIGLNYEKVLSCLLNENMMKKFVIKFLDDKSFQELKEGLAAADGEKAFRAAHTLKGVCLNLGFDNLYKVSAELTEKLRGLDTTGSEELFEAVKTEYVKLTDAIKQID